MEAPARTEAAAAKATPIHKLPHTRDTVRSCQWCSDLPGRTSLYAVADAHYQSGYADPLLSKREEKGQREHWHHVWDAFVEQLRSRDETIVDYYFCQFIRGACLQTAQTEDPEKACPKLHMVIPSCGVVPPWITDQLMECRNLQTEIRMVLTQPDNQICTDMLFGLAVQLMQHAESYEQRLQSRLLELFPRAHAELLPAPSPAQHWSLDGYGAPDQSAAESVRSTTITSGEVETPTDAASAQDIRDRWDKEQERQQKDFDRYNKTVDLVTDSLRKVAKDDPLREAASKQLTVTRDFYRRSAERLARTQYSIGMLAGFGLILLALVGGAFIRYTPLLEPFRSPDAARGLDAALGLLATAVGFGGIGAVVSVMQRMTAGSLSLSRRSSNDTLFRVGGFRPVVGAVFAAVTLMVLHSGLVSVSAVPAAESGKLWYFYAAVAFLAGFSERWAQDVLATASAGIGGSGTKPSAEVGDSRLEAQHTEAHPAT